MPRPYKTFLPRPAETDDLAAAYEQAVRRADDLSDRLRREANRVANRATLQAQQLSLQQQTAELGRQQAAAVEQLQQIDAQWRQTWQPAGIDPLPPREMQAWIQRQQGLVQQAQTIRQRTASLEQLEEQIAAHCRQLQSCLDDVARGSCLQESELRSASGDAGRRRRRRLCQPSLDALLARGDSILEQIKETAESRRQLEREKNRLAKAVTQAEAKAVQAEADLTQWRAQWTAAIQPLGLPGDSSPVAVNEVVAQTAELFARLKEAAGFAERIDGIGRDSLRFRQDVERLLQTVDPDHPSPGDRFQEALEELLGRLRRAMTDQKNLDLLQSQRKKQEEKRQQAHTAVETLRARLAVLCQEARCQSPEELPAAEAASAEVLRLRQEREACHAQLLELAAGATIDALMAEAAAISARFDSRASCSRSADAMSDLERTRGELRETIGGEKTVLAGMDTSAAAAEAAEDAQDILARLEPDVQQYLRLRLASAVLARRDRALSQEERRAGARPGERPVPAADARFFRGLADRFRRSRRAGLGRRAARRQDGPADRDERGDLRSALPGPATGQPGNLAPAGRADAVHRRRHSREFRQPAGRGDARSSRRVIRADAGDLLRPSRASRRSGHAVHVGRRAVRASALGPAKNTAS